jgi:3-hydroxyacyl-CoA dehydrogenase / enoyl-CoA hydratase / 3-hydroxybutyryl-CoA epimerase
MAIYQCDTLTVERDRDGSVFLKLDVPDKGINVFDKRVLFDFDVALDHVLAEGRVPILIIRSGKPSGFIAGADISSFTSIKSVAEAAEFSELGQRLFDKLAGLPMPTVAMISGPCLGGGLECALACDYRVVYDSPKTQLGLPEVELGLIPGWGGTQRLPRTIGLERALRVLIGRKRVNAREAFDWGLADARPANEVELREAFERVTARALRDGKAPHDRLPLWTWRQRLLESNPFGRSVLFRGTERILRKRTWEDFPAPAEALEVVRTGLRDGMKAGLKAEREAISRLALTPACRNMVGLFLANEQIRKSAIDEDRPEVQRVGIVGAGVMGAGIAQLAALKGWQVVVQEVNETALGTGLARITDLFRKAAERGVVTASEAERRLSAVKGTVNWEGFSNVDVVVEAAVEELEAKRALFRELEKRTRPGAVLATNTSSLPVAALQEGLGRPERVAGMHFFNPVHRMPLVEVARTPATGAATTEFLTRWTVALGKTPVNVKDSPGFVVNRVLMPYLNEAVLLVSEGMKIADLDRTMMRFGMPMGPLELLDQIGLDIAAHVARSVGPVMEGRFPPNDAFEKMRANGWLGQKGGKGFYVYHGKKSTVNPLAENLLRSGLGSDVDRALPPAVRLSEARERMVLLMVNEAALAFSEGLTDDAESLDLAMVMGTGWAPHRGGPLHYADDRTAAEVVRKLNELAGRHGKRFEACAELLRRAETNQRFNRLIGMPG